MARSSQTSCSGRKAPWSEGATVQLAQPAAVDRVALAPGDMLDLAPIDQGDLEAALAQQLVEGDPVDTGALHGDAADPTLLQPIGQGEQAMGHGGEFAHRFSIPIRGHTDPVGLGADIDAGGIGLDHDQVVNVDLACHA